MSSESTSIRVGYQGSRATDDTAADERTEFFAGRRQSSDNSEWVSDGDSRIERCKHLCKTHQRLVFAAVGVVAVFAIALSVTTSITQGARPDEAPTPPAGDDLEELPGLLENVAMDAIGYLTQYATDVRDGCRSDAAQTTHLLRQSHAMVGDAWAGIAAGVLRRRYPHGPTISFGSNFTATSDLHARQFSSFAALVDTIMPCPWPPADAAVAAAVTAAAIAAKTPRCPPQTHLADARRVEFEHWHRVWIDSLADVFRVDTKTLRGLQTEALRHPIMLIDQLCQGDVDTTDCVSDCINSAGAIGRHLDVNHRA